MFPLPCIENMNDCLSGARFLYKVDSKNGYHQTQIIQGNEWKTSFKTNDRLCKWLVIPSGLVNIANTFTRLMNGVLKGFRGNISIVYLDDILV